ncbi:MAG TPA: hypothetical protein VGQ83_42500 [Polyangia bacterium]
MTRRPLLFGGVVRFRRALGDAVRYLDYGLDAATLGLFPDSYLDALTLAHYDSALNYHSDEHRKRGLFDWEQAAVAAHFGRPGTVLITSAGGGREALALLELGWRVVATECTPSLHARLAHNLRDAVGAGQADAFLAPPDHVCLERAPYDAAIVGRGAYTRTSSAATAVSRCSGPSARRFDGAARCWFPARARPADPPRPRHRRARERPPRTAAPPPGRGWRVDGHG